MSRRVVVMVGLAVLCAAAAFAAPAPLPKPERTEELTFDAGTPERARLVAHYLRSIDFAGAMLSTNDVRKRYAHFDRTDALSDVAKRLSVTAENALVRLRVRGGPGALCVAVVERLTGKTSYYHFQRSNDARHDAELIKASAESSLCKLRTTRDHFRLSFLNGRLGEKEFKEIMSKLEREMGCMEIELEPLRVLGKSPGAARKR